MIEVLNYTPLSIQDYLLTKKIKDLSQEIKDEITAVRQNLEFMSWNIYQELLKIGVLERKVKLRHPRSLYVKDSEVVYFNHYNAKFETVAVFKEETDETV